MYHAIVDGTNGNTILNQVNGSFLNTSLVAKGGVISTPGKPGRIVTLDITMDRARLEDVLQLAVKSARPPMTGALRLNTKFVLPPESARSSNGCVSTASSRSPARASPIRACRRKSTS